MARALRERFWALEIAGRGGEMMRRLVVSAVLAATVMGIGAVDHAFAQYGEIADACLTWNPSCVNLPAGYMTANPSPSLQPAIIPSMYDFRPLGGAAARPVDYTQGFAFWLA